MSMFWIGGPDRTVKPSELKPEMFEDRYFLPGIIHGGEDYLIRVYLNDACGEEDPEEFCIEYLSKDLILKAHNEDPSHEGSFNQTLSCEAECFGCYNDASGDFASLVEAWDEAVYLTKSQLVAWAEGRYVPKPQHDKVDRAELPEFIGQIIDTFEDFLEEKGIDIPNDEKNDRDDPESAAIIYGTDYGQLQMSLEELMLGWGIIEREV
ncbi:MAG: hypothetical protein J6D57_14790 [Mogibacterium sp.]|nr:hypothetical protein [Mogibacterium sp.]